MGYLQTVIAYYHGKTTCDIMLQWPTEQICPGCSYGESEAINNPHFYRYLNEQLLCQHFALETDFAALFCSWQENVFVLAHRKAIL